MYQKIPKHIQELIDRYLTDELSEEEHQILNDWFFQIENSRQEIHAENQGNTNLETIKNRLQNKIWTNLPVQKASHMPNTMRKIGLQIAASLLLISGIGLWFHLQRDYSDYFKTAQVQNLPDENAWSPPTNNVFLLRQDSTYIHVDQLLEAQNNVFENISISKDQSVLRFSNEIATNQLNLKDTEWQQLVVPKGNQFDFYLPDGTRVWLNADSKLTFPVAFNGHERVVSLEGEAYFKVHSDEKHPFFVKTKMQEIRVTGTTFNVSTYSDDPSEKTSLYEGKVEIRNMASGRTTQLQPGYSGTIYGASTELEKFELPNEMEPDWKSNIFFFENEDQSSIIRKIARWYALDYDIQSLGNPNNLYSGKIRKSAGIQEVIKMIEMIMPLEIQLQNRQLIIKAKNK